MYVLKSIPREIKIFSEFSFPFMVVSLGRRLWSSSLHHSRNHLSFISTSCLNFKRFWLACHTVYIIKTSQTYRMLPPLPSSRSCFLFRQIINVKEPEKSVMILKRKVKYINEQWEKQRAGGEGDDTGWDGWMTSPTQWTWIWVNSRSWWWTGRPGVLGFIGLQSVGHYWATTELKMGKLKIFRDCSE